MEDANNAKTVWKTKKIKRVYFQEILRFYFIHITGWAK